MKGRDFMRQTNFKSVYQLTYLPNLFPVNVYLIDEGNELTLIDTGLSAMVPEIIAFSSKLKKTITKIVLTHCHMDHIGGLKLLKSELPDAKIIVPYREARFLNGDYSLDQNEPDLPLKGGYPKNQIIHYDETVKDGDRIGSLTVISTPGHTPGSTSYFSEKNGVILVGDALQVKGGLAVAGKVNLTFPFPALATWSKELSLQSAKRIAALNPQVIGSGHGNLLYDPKQALEQAIVTLSQKL